MPRQSRFFRHIAGYLDYQREARSASPHTLSNYERDLQHLAAWLLETGEPEANPDWAQVTHLHLRRYARTLDSYATASQMRRLSAIRSFFRWLENEGAVSHNPAVRVAAFKKPASVPVILSVEQIERLMAEPDLLSATGKRDRALLEVLYGTGIRSSECVALTMDDVNWRAGEIVVRDSGGRTGRALPLGRAALQASRDYVQNARPELASGRRTGKKPQSANALWLSSRGLPLSQVALYLVVQRCARRTGLSEHVTPQTLRDCCAAHMLQNGASETLVQEFLGHRSAQIARRYQVSGPHTVQGRNDNSVPE